MKTERIDVTGKIGQLNGNTEAEWTMYSFDRPSHYFWNGVANGLKKKGFNEEEIKVWLPGRRHDGFLMAWVKKLSNSEKNAVKNKI